VRTPSRVDSDLYLPGQPPYVLAGGANFESETVLAYELGYRTKLADRLVASLAWFWNDYSNIRSLSTNATSNNALVFANDNGVQQWGLEFSATYQVTDWWRFRGGYTYLHKDAYVRAGGSDTSGGNAEGNDPQQQFVLQAMLDFPGHVEWGWTLRYVDSLPNPHVPAYITADVRLAWRPWKHLEVSVVGQNLFDNQHPEFGPEASRLEIPRSLYGKITLHF
jgi:iron complex outermembrane receptor protein